MRFRFVGFCRLALAMASFGCAAGCAAWRPAPANAGSTTAGPQVSGVWDAVTSATIDEGVAAGDVRIEKQEWHLSQSGSAIRGYYIAALTYVSGDGRPYVCSRQPQFSAFQRFEVAGQVQSGAIEIRELGQAESPKENRCDPGMRQLARYRGLLEVDLDTWEVKPIAFTTVHEIGKAIHPLLAVGQIEGGSAQGLGYALLEDVVMRDGRMANAQLTNYIIPTTLDTPRMQVTLIENPYPHGPFGAKGVGEMPIDGPAPAVINALRHAGFDVRDIPATPERIMAATNL